MSTTMTETTCTTFGLIAKKCPISELMGKIMTYCRHPVADMFLESRYGTLLRDGAPSLYAWSIKIGYLQEAPKMCRGLIPGQRHSGTMASPRDCAAFNRDIWIARQAVKCRCTECQDIEYDAYNRYRRWEKSVSDHNLRREACLRRYAVAREEYKVKLQEYVTSMEVDREYLEDEGDGPVTDAQFKAFIKEEMKDCPIQRTRLTTPRKPRVPNPKWKPLGPYVPRMPRYPHLGHHYCIGLVVKVHHAYAYSEFDTNRACVRQPYAYDGEWFNQTRAQFQYDHNYILEGEGYRYPLTWRAWIRFKQNHYINTEMDEGGSRQEYEFMYRENLND